MSRELTGQSGYIVGSEGYFRQLNQASFIGNLMRSKQKCNYYDVLNAISNRVLSISIEVYNDLCNHSDQIQSIPQPYRETLVKMLLEMYDICKITSSGNGRIDDCVSMLKVQIYETRSNPFAIFRTNTFAFSKNIPETNMRFGREVGTSDYLAYIESFVFGEKISAFYDNPGNIPEYGKLIKDALENIAASIARDVEQGERNNDYIKDENAEKLKDTSAQFERCGVHLHGFTYKLNKLAWFVGGNETQIRELQKKLNMLNIGGTHGKLTEDGVYGKETASAWDSFINKLMIGTVPSLNWVNPLQTNLTGIGVGSGRYGVNNALVNVRDIRMNTPQYLRVDPPHTSVGRFRGTKQPIDYNHINIFDKPTNAIQGKANYWYNHYPLSDRAYNTLKRFDGVAKKVRIAGKVLLIAGIALDALELGMAIDADLRDADKRLGRKTVSTAAKIGGRWVGGLAGAKLGAMGGAAIGTAIFPGVGTVVGGFVGGLVLGIAGALGGDALAEWVVDITYVED